MAIKAVSDQRPTTLAFCFSEAEQEVDIYSQERIEVIKKERFNAGCDFYLAITESYGKKFFFDGARFTEEFVRKKEHNQTMYHPLTREVVTSMKIFKANRHDSGYEEKYDENSVRHHVNCLPVFLSDPSKPNKEKRVYYFMLAYCYQHGKTCEVDIDSALLYLEKSAHLGYEDAQLVLSSLLRGRGVVRESIYWAIKPWENLSMRDISMRGLIDIGNCFETLKYYNEAFRFYYAGACRGDAHAIAKIVCYYNQGLGFNRSPSVVSIWRRFIPAEWQNKDSFQYLQYTCRPEFSTVENKLELPEEIIKGSFDFPLPKASDFPETNSLWDQFRNYFTPRV